MAMLQILTIILVLVLSASGADTTWQQLAADQNGSSNYHGEDTAIFTEADNQLTDAQYKRKSPSSGQKSTDAGQRTSSIKSINTRAIGAPSGGSGSNDEPTMAGGQILSLLLDLSRNMAAMSDVINEIRFQNHVTYRQLKRIQLQQGKCNRAYSSMTSSHAATGYQPMKPEMGQKLQSFVKSAALYAERPQSDQQQQHIEDSNQLQSVTLTSANASELSQQQVVERCPKEFTYSSELDSCYRMAGDRTTWRLARERCRDFNGDLAKVDSAREQRYLNEKARHNPDTKHCDFWIGLVRGRGSVESGSSWHWIGDHGNGRSPDYTNWNVNEPNNANSYEHCTQMLWVFNWRWNDAHCNYGNACYICQAKPRVMSYGEFKAHHQYNNV